MAMRSVVVSRTGLSRLMDANRQLASTSGHRYFSDGKGRVLSEEELAKENVYIQKWERERLEKLERQKQKAEKEKAEDDKSQKKPEEATHKS